jgi:hypothetical protein
VINELKGLLGEKNYRVVTSAGAIALEEKHNFILVLTPERLLYLLIRHPNISINLLFVDEAHKISTKDSRTAFYYKVIDMLVQRKDKPNIIFASPNIPNPDVFLGLIPNVDKDDKKLASLYTPVSQIKYVIDFIDDRIKFYNEHSQDIVNLCDDIKYDFNTLLKKFYNSGKNTIIYINNKDKVMEEAKEFANDLTDLPDKDLQHLSNEIKTSIHKDYFLADMVLKGVAFHIAYLPSAIRIRLEELYRERKIRILFCTSTLIEGVNLPADNLFVTTYIKGNSTFAPVDFYNLIGRVGRIEYNLYGNVFFARIEERTKEDNFIELLKNGVPNLTLSLVTELTDKHKEIIVNSLLNGNIEIPKDDTIKDDEYPFIRKFAIILLRDIMKDRHSVVRKEFVNFLTIKKEKQIREKFSKLESKPDDDINASVDQTNRLIYAIRNGLEYPQINEDGNADFNAILYFLEKLYDIFKWDKYETKELKNKNSLRFYALILSQWVDGRGLSFITNSSIEYAQRMMRTNKPKKTSIYHKQIIFDNSQLHKNIIIGEVLETIETIVLFRFANYFLKFSEKYKEIKKIETIPNDWYDFVEYGTTNKLSIFLQRNGFSRETSLYIKQNKFDYVVIIDGVYKLRKEILEKAKESVRKEIQEVMYNIPELFYGDNNMEETK